MKIESFKHCGVKPDGTFENEDGSVVVNGRIIMSKDNGGCRLDNCHCSDGHWLSITKPRTDDGVVEGLLVTFKNKAEMDVFLKNRELS